MSAAGLAEMNVSTLVKCVCLNVLFSMAALTVFNCLLGYTPSQLIVASGGYGAAFGCLDYWKKSKRSANKPALIDRFDRSKPPAEFTMEWSLIGIVSTVVAWFCFLLFTPISLVAAVLLNLDSRHALAIAVTWAGFVWLVTAVLLALNRKVSHPPG